MSIASYSKVSLFADTNYRGKTATIDASTSGVRYVPDIVTSGFPRNDVTSMKIAPFTHITISPELGNPVAPTLTVKGPIEIPDMRNFPRAIDNYNDRLQSIIVKHVPPTSGQIIGCCNGSTSPTECGPLTPGSALCENSIANACSTDMGSTFCQSWCRTHPELCDAHVTVYCAKNTWDPYCACILSKATGVVNPKCVDDKCIRTGYMTTNMRNTPCPSIINCSIQPILANSGVSLATVVPIEQNCGNTTITNTGTGTSTSTSAPPPTTTITSKPPQYAPGFSPAPTPAPNYTLLVFIIVIFLAIVSTLAVFMLIGDDQEATVST